MPQRFDLLPDGYEAPKPTRMTCKLRVGNDTNARAPALKGFVALDEATARELLQRVIDSPQNVLFLSIALWNVRPDDESDYQYRGEVSVNEYVPPKQKEPEHNGELLDWS